MKWDAFYRLMRLDKPIGILLLWYPTAWALWLANQGLPPIKLIILFFVGTVLMRSAGCVINDIADRNIDKHISRTKLRPLTAGELSLESALFLLALLLISSLMILLCLPPTCFIWAIIAVLFTAIYPFCKRFLSAPQVVLGFAFSMGIPMAYVASGAPLDKVMVLLVILNFCWIVAYDTMYAMVDREDDLKIGVKSTAIYFAQYDRLIIGILLWVMHILWLVLAHFSLVRWYFYAFWLLACGVVVYQQKLIHKRETALCFRAFLVSSYYGVLMWIAVM